MTRYSIAKMDAIIDPNHEKDFNKVLREIAKRITKEIDPEFPIKAFLKWCDSSEEKPFRANGNVYHWE